ncbi:hypothetical protein B0O99DRAFT_696671 [Bisporella sp. PMI_857]|nr:hypothetical protein B0O99DRAFT_696671 [Bisporella sp. PMI_857]
MFLCMIVLSCLLWQNVAATPPDPMITAVPIRPTHENLRRQRMMLEFYQRLEKRATSTSNPVDEIHNEMITYCFGDGSICDQSLSLYRECRAANGPSSQLIDWNKMEICQCTSGTFAADQECSWCEFAFNTSDTIVLNLNSRASSVCSSHSVAFASVPASAEAIVSAWNATYTGVKPTGGTVGAAISTSVSGTLNSNSVSGRSTTSSRFGLGLGTTTSTFFGGGSGQTTAPSLATHSEATQSSSTAKSSLGVECVQNWGLTLHAALWSVVAWFLAV